MFSDEESVYVSKKTPLYSIIQQIKGTRIVLIWIHEKQATSLLLYFQLNKYTLLRQTRIKNKKNTFQIWDEKYKIFTPHPTVRTWKKSKLNSVKFIERKHIKIQDPYNITEPKLI